MHGLISPDAAPRNTGANLATQRARVRILATSDLHMQLIAYDYVKDRQTGGDSLARLATLIRNAQSEANEMGALCLLVDNGDTLQGNPLGSFLASERVTPNPMVTAMNALGYDAVGLGNHDFDHGMEHLARAMAQFEAPMLSSNVRSDRLPALQSAVVLNRVVPLASGGTEALKIGVVSALPQQTATWNRQHLDRSTRITGPIDALKTSVAQVKSDGADLVIALSHMGIAQFDEGDDAQNQTADVAALDHINAVVAGHTHLRFPGPDHASVVDVDCDRGLIFGKAVVMPGSGGSDLGVIDLELERAGTEAPWQVVDQTVRLQELTADIREEAAIAMLANDAHLATRRKLAEPVAELATPMHSYFALAAPSPVPALMAAAKCHAIERAVRGTDLAELPLLAAAATPATGGFEGPENFVTLPAGQLERRHIAGLIPFANQVWAVKATGARIIGWLERSALIFNVLKHRNDDQILIDPQVPGFRYDAIYGLTYQIDLTVRSRFDAAGRACPEETGRVSDVLWRGEPIRPNQEFLVAVTDHRAGGGGTFRPFEDDDIVVRGHAPLKQALIDYLGSSDPDMALPPAPWRFASASGLSAILYTAPDALNHLADIAGMRPEPCGFTQDGFARLRLHL